VTRKIIKNEEIGIVEAMGNKILDAEYDCESDTSDSCE